VCIVCFTQKFRYQYLKLRTVKLRTEAPRLLSVQVNQTPGLYVGPGVYPGPGLYRNMSRLCYFIKNNRQLTCLPGTTFILYSYCGNDVIAFCFTSKQHPYLTNPPPSPGLYVGPVQVNQTLRGPGSIRGPASIRSFTVLH